MCKSSWLILLALSAALTTFSSIASGTAGQPESGVVFVTVTDDTGRLVTGLESRHFALFEGDEERAITSFSFEETPVSLGIAFAGGAPTRLADMRAALKLLVEQGQADNEVFLIGNVPLAEAVARAHDKLTQSRQPKRALLILTDGTEINDDLLRQSRVPVYLTSVNETQAFSAERQAVLRELAQASGGQASFPASTNELGNALAHIGLELRHQYRLGYTAAPGSQPRNLKVSLHPPRGLPALTARVSRGAWLRQ